MDEGPRPPGRPLWMPEGADLERMPVEIRQAVAEILRPAYEELVDQAGSGMEKSLGASLVHLLWLEILEQYDIKKDYCKFDLLLEVDGTRGFAIDRYLKLVNSKLRMSSMLTRLRQLRLKEQNISPLPQAGTTKWSGQGVRAANDVNSSKNLQKQKFAHENQSPLPLPPSPLHLRKDQNVQNPKFAHEKESTPINQPPTSSLQEQTWKNYDLAPKNDSTFPLPSPLTPLPSSAFPDQKVPNM
jgi:hypothetical protein